MDSQHLHILFLPRWYPNKFDPMFGLFIRQHALVAAKSHKVSVLYVQFCEQKNEVEWITSNKDIYEVSAYILKSKNPCINLFRWLSAYKKGIHLIQQNRGKIQCSHVHILTRLAVIAYSLKLFGNIPYVITEHWSRYQKGRDFKGWARKLATRWVVKNANAITTPSLNLQNAMQQHRIFGNYSVLSNTVSKSLFYPTLNQHHSTFQIIHISCFEEQSKNMSGILRSIQKLKSLRSDFHLTMVGTGMDFDETVELAHKLNILDVVTFTGMLQGETLAAQLRQSDLLIMFSHYENMPVVISEALCCGIPVVSSDVGGIHEVLSPDFGILVPVNDENAFIEAIQRVMKNPEFYSKNIIAEKASKIWHEDAVLTQLNALYAHGK